MAVVMEFAASARAQPSAGGRRRSALSNDCQHALPLTTPTRL